MFRLRIHLILAALMVALTLVLGGCDGDPNADIGGNEGVIESNEGLIEGEGALETEVEND